MLGASSRLRVLLSSDCVPAQPLLHLQFLFWPIGVALIVCGLTTIRPAAWGRAYSLWLDKHKLTTLFPVLFNWGWAWGLNIISYSALPQWGTWLKTGTTHVRYGLWYPTRVSGSPLGSFQLPLLPLPDRPGY